MIFITAKFKVKPEYADDWPQITAEFTRATREEPGCLWFDWSRSIDDPSEYVLVEAFRDGAAGVTHVQSKHFKSAQQTLPPHLARDAQDRQLRDPAGQLVRTGRTGGQEVARGTITRAAGVSARLIAAEVSRRHAAARPAPRPIMTAVAA